MNKENIYLRLPTLLQNVFCSIEGERIKRSRYNRAFRALLAAAEERSFWSRERIQEYRNQQLQTFVHHCATTVPFYRRRFQESGISPNQIRTLEDLQCLPILTKSEVQEHYAELISDVVPKQQQVIAHTSGTTGGGLRFATTLEAMQKQWATWWRYRGWHGIDLETWCGYFGGRSVVPLPQAQPPFWRSNYPGKQILFSAYHMSPHYLDAYINAIRRKQPPWLHGYPSLLTLLATHLLESKIDLGYEIRWITIGAENLLPQQSTLIERAFGVLPIQHYGCAEAVANISQCDYGALHVDEDFAAVEFVPNPYSAGYKIIGTNFTNPAVPLLRYDVQDIVDLAYEQICPCGRPGRIVTQIDGRQEDYVVLKNGSRLGRMDHVFKDMIHIKEAQIYQKMPGEITLRIVRSPNFTQTDSELLLQETQKRVGNDTSIQIEYVDQLKRSRTGKLRFVVSEIPSAQIKQSI